MNKYQNSLNDMYAFTKRNLAGAIDDTYSEDRDNLQELVDKATPKKTITTFGTAQHCPTCEALIPNHCHKYCWKCGQAIVWGGK